MECLSVIQGDTLNVFLELEYPEDMEISKVIFSSHSLDLSVEMEPTLEKDIWYFEVSSDDTANFRIGNFTYDVTVENSEAQVFTVLYKEPIAVLQKTN